MLSVTPHDYEPPGFHEVENSSFIFPSESLSCKLGEVVTPFHGLKFNAKMEITKLENLKEDKTSSHRSRKLKVKDPEKNPVIRNTAKLQVYGSIY
jgi:hypothetical protein